MAKNVLTIDRYVEHVSTVPAISGQVMRQFVRERVLEETISPGSKEVDEGKVVLMVHGGFWPCSVAFDCPHPGYSWMEALALEGFDVFALDMTGHGRSALQVQDLEKNVQVTDRHFMRSAEGSDEEPSYPYQLVTSDTETADLNAVIDFIRDLRGVKKVHLIGWSGGGIRTGTYVRRHPNKIERLVIWASSNYLPDGPDASPGALPSKGAPTAFQSKEHGESVRWLANVKSEGQIEDPAVIDVVWRAGAEADPVGASWGGLRGPTRTYWGWNRNGAAEITLPVLHFVGEFDGLLERNILLYKDLGSSEKIFLRIAGASHFMQWERGRHVQRRAVSEFLRDGTLIGKTSGEFRADEEGLIIPLRS